MSAARRAAALELLLEHAWLFLVRAHERDPASDERGPLFPIVADTLDPDPFTQQNLVSVSVRPGIVLRGHTRYAFVLRRGFATDAERSPGFAELGVSRDDVLVATVFTTGDEIAMLRERSEAIRMRDDVVISNVTFDHSLPDVCVLTGTAKMPQYQVGTAPFSTDGRFELDENGGPTKQGSMSVPLKLTIPGARCPRVAGRAGTTSTAPAVHRSISSTRE